MIDYPNINPVLIHFTDTFQIRWYGVMYLFGFAVAWFLLRHRTKHLPGWESSEKLSDLIFYCALGVIIGGRLGYMLFYAFPEWIHDPLQLIKVWKGGMSFHGGLIGVVTAIWIFARHQNTTFFTIADLVAPAVPIGLGLGRIGNFINGELWGNVTDVPWAMVFPLAGPLPRHPSPLYAVLLEGVLLFAIVWIYSSKPRKPGAVMGMFLFAYGCIRVFEEFFRQPDPQYGYFAFNWLTMGQILCIPMIAIGLYLLCAPNRQATTALKEKQT